MQVVKSKVQIAAERYGLDPSQLGVSHRYRFTSFVAIAAGNSQQATPVRIENDCLLVGLGGQPLDGTAASYAGMDLFFTYAGRDFCSDGQTAAGVPFGVLFGNQSHPVHEWEVPVFLRKGDTIIAKVQNNTAGPVTPAVIAYVVEIRGKRS